MSIYFDLDGVIRDLCAVTGETIYSSWDRPINGMGFSEFFNRNLHLLLEAPPTEYYSVIVNCHHPIKIISAQPDHWQQLAVDWMNAYFGDIETEIIFDNDKLHLLSEDDILVEDYPKYSDYSQIILIDRPYNQMVTGMIERIKEPNRLKEILESCGKA